MSSHPHGMRFSPFSAGNKTAILSAQQQPQQQTPIQQNVIMRQHRKSATPTNIPVPTPKTMIREPKPKNTGFSDTDDDEQDYFDDELDANLSREERFVLLQPRAEPQGQENLSGNVTPVNDTQRKSHRIPQLFRAFCQQFSVRLFSFKYLREGLIDSSDQDSLFECIDRLNKPAGPVQQCVEQSQLVGWYARSSRQWRQSKEFAHHAATLK